MLCVLIIIAIITTIVYYTKYIFTTYYICILHIILYNLIFFHYIFCYLYAYINHKISKNRHKYSVHRRHSYWWDVQTQRKRKKQYPIEQVFLGTSWTSSYEMHALLSSILCRFAFINCQTEVEFIIPSTGKRIIKNCNI